ncbi:HelD family protein [Clostridium tunisiense]|uniref:HelD family protein n=1 Tax=Clostridium tunisiense TaxID=219748 RepID=UPI0002E04555|nr:UvrD-helicase domain-containing protein [Clostridium tunisiense]
MSNEINEEIKKQLEISIEEGKLSDTIRIINEEILKYIEKRKGISEYILDYRKKFIEEYRDDEDKVIEYFDHERYVKEEAFKTIDRRLKELNILKVSPYFGRVDFREGDFGVEQIYIGRFGVTPEESFEPLIVDWRAPISSIFYNGGIGEGYYEAPKGKVEVSVLQKRQFIIKKGKLEGLFDSAVDVKDDILQMMLSKNSSDKLKDIIMTIQKEQDDIIRQSRTETVVVDGVAGSGKTTIALHRVAYLLYNYRKILEDKVLILGPNNIFMEYISTVLPSLGESGVLQTTFKDFVLDILDIDNVISLKDIMERFLTGDKNYEEEISYKTSIEYKHFLDEYVDKLNKAYFSSKNIEFRKRKVISSEEMEKMFSHEFYMLPLFRRCKKVKRIIFSRLKDVRDEEFRRIQKEYDEEKASYSKDELIFHINNLDFNRKLKIRELIQELIEIKKTLEFLNPPDVISLYEEINSGFISKELTEIDLGALLYLKVKLEGIKSPREVKHIVIDEAQDYSLMQFIAIKEYTRAVSMTIVGDSNQRILPMKDNKPPMLAVDEFISNFNTKEFTLNKSYRSTREIMEYSNKFLKAQSIVPLVRSGDSVVEVEAQNNEELSKLIETYVDTMKNKELENVAIITRDLEDAYKIKSIISNNVSAKVIDRENVVHRDSLIIIPSYFAKGLEFDGVVVVNTGKQELITEDKLMYVMCTRALHNLFVIKTSELVDQ